MEAAPPLPRALEVLKFASARELEVRALCDALQDPQHGAGYGAAALPRSLRRRAGSHNPYKHRRRPNLKKAAAAAAAELATAGAALEEGSDAPPQQQADQPAAPQVFENRRMRRRAGRLQSQFQAAGRWDLAAVAGDTPDGQAPPALKRLETHLWHAKRQATVQRWGWALPEGDPGCGRGSRAFARRLRTGAVLHDASYWCPLSLAGPLSALSALLGTMLAPSEAGLLGLGAGLGAEPWEQPVTLHHAGAWPRRAVGPALVTHLPASAQPAIAAATDAMDVDGGPSTAAEGQPRPEVQLLLWVHAAAVVEAHAALAAALAAQAGGGARLSVLDLRRLELRGRTADDALAAVLQRAQPREAAGPAALPAALAGLRDGEAAQMVLPDPRLTKPVALGSASAELLPPPAPAGDASSAGEQLSISQGGVVPAPLPEAAISAKRQRLRRELLGLPSEAESAAAASAPAQAEPSKPQQQEEAQGGTHCPALLIRHVPPARTGVPGWSVVLPAGWVLPLWLALVFENCAAIGQREWRWLHTTEGAPFFPHDHPDTQAHAALMQQVAAERAASAAKRPKGKVAPGPPCPLPWDALQPQREAESDAPQQQEAAEPAGPGPIFVARTPCALELALWGRQDGAGNGLLVDTSQARPVRNALREGRLQWQPAAGQPQSQPGRHPGAAALQSGGAAGASTARSAGALLEVSVHVVKKGTAVEGAELCWLEGEEAASGAATLHLAPRCRSGSDSGVDAAVSSSDPEGEVLIGREGLRTLGFVTSEVPRGASRASGATALCSAASLWRLRSLQHHEPTRDWGVVRAFLRNPDSTALHPVRLAVRMESQGGGS